MSCLPNVASFSGLSSPYNLCTQCCQLLWLATLGTKDIRWRQSRETGNIGYTRHMAKTNNPEKLATLGTQDISWIVCLRLMSCVPNVASFSGLFVFTLCLVYPMLPVSLDCLHLITCVPNNPEKLATLGKQDIRWRQTIQRNWQHWVHNT
jgi:hypothetical protein